MSESQSPHQLLEHKLRLAGAKYSLAARRLDVTANDLIDPNVAKPRLGDMLLGRFLEGSGKIVDVFGRHVSLYAGDEVVLACADPQLPLGDSPLVLVDPCGIAVGACNAEKTGPKFIPTGWLARPDGAALNLSAVAIPPAAAAATVARNVFGVVGCSHGSGQIAVASHLVRGLTRVGARVGAGVLDGVASSATLWELFDAGAICAFDTVDFGHCAPRILEISTLERLAADMLMHLEAQEVDAVVLVFTDGLLRRLPAALLSDAIGVGRRLEHIFLAANDAMGAVAGTRWLRGRGMALRAVTGPIADSPLARREAEAEAAVEVVSLRDFLSAARAARLFFTRPEPRGYAHA